MSDSRIICKRMSEVVPEAISWLWPDRIAKGKLTLIIGDPGQGKGLLTLDLAARATTGKAWPGEVEVRSPGSVILLTPEDDPGDTIRPRLDVSGADTSRIHIVLSVMSGAGLKQERSFTLADDVEHLKTLVEELGDCVLIIIDPLSAYFGTEKDSYKDTHVRALMMPLVQLAASTGVAIMCVSHMNKAQGSAVTRGMGSIGFTAVARTVWMLEKSPKDNDVRVLLPVKCNITKDNQAAAFRVVPKLHPALNSLQPAIEWIEGDFEMTADQFLAMQGTINRPDKLSEAEEFLNSRLAGGPVAASELLEEAESEGISGRTLQRAKGSLNIKVEKGSGVLNGPWKWSLPQPDEVTSVPA